MAESAFARFVAELKRRKVFRVAAGYALVAWICVQVADTFFPALRLPSWTVTLVAVIILLGFPVALLLAWAFDVTDEGITRMSGPRLLGRPPVRRLVALVVVAGLLIGAGIWWSARDGAAEEFSRSSIAVLPFAYRGGDDYAYLARGMVDLLATNLDGAGDLRAVDPHALMKYLGGDSAVAAERERGIEIARRFGAGMFVTGSITEAAGQLRANATLFGADGVEIATTQSTASGQSGVFDLVDDLTRQLVAARSTATGDHVARIASRTTRSIEALRAYLEGEQRFINGDYAGAVEPLQRAIAVDTAFALAYYRLGVVESWLYNEPAAITYAQSALRFGGRLTADDQLLLQGFAAFISGQADEAVYRELLVRAPDNAEAWYQLGETLIHYNPVRGRRVVEAREPFERALAFVPDQAEAQLHLAQLASAGHDDEALAPLLDRVMATDAEPERFEATRAFALGDSAARIAVIQRLLSLPAFAAGGALWELSTIRMDLAATRRVAAALAAEGELPHQGLGAFWLRAVALAEGRFDSADSIVDAQFAHAPVASTASAAEPLLFAALLPFIPPDRSRISQLRAEVSALPAPPPLREGDANPIAAAHPVTRQYLLGLASARLGDAPAALRSATSIEEMTTGVEFADTLARALAAGIRAELALNAGKPEEALEYLRRIHVEYPSGLRVGSPYYSLTRERYLLAIALEEAGRHQEAMRWFASLPDRNTYGLTYLAMVQLHQARLLELRGDRVEAIRHYARFLELWGEADAEVQPRVRAARERLDRLTAEGSS